MFLRLIKAVTQWQMFPSGDPPKTKNFSAKFHAPSINSLEYRSNPLSYPLKYSFKCPSSQKSRESFPFPAPFPCIFRGWSLQGWTRRIRGTREGGSSKKGASLSFFLYIYGGQSGERLLPPSFMPRFNTRLPKRRIPPGRIPPFDLPCPTVAPRLDHGNGSCL